MAVFLYHEPRALPSQDNDEPPSSHQRAAVTSQSCRKITEPTAAQGRSTLTLPDVLPRDASGRFTQSECPLGQLERDGHLHSVAPVAPPKRALRFFSHCGSAATRAPESSRSDLLR